MRRSENVKRQGMRIAFSCRTVRDQNGEAAPAGLPAVPGAAAQGPGADRRTQHAERRRPGDGAPQAALGEKAAQTCPSATAKMMEAPIAPITPPARLVSRCARARAAPITLVSAAMWVIPSMNRMAMSVV